MELTAIEKFQVERYKRGKTIVDKYRKKVLEYIEWEKEQQNKDK